MLVVLMSLAISVRSTGVAAEGDSDASQYRAVIEEALQEFERGNWEEAEALFTRAHELSPSARTLRGMGLAAYEARHYADAIEHITAALRDERRKLPPEQRSDLQKTLQHAQSFVAGLTLRITPAQAQLQINGRSARAGSDGVVLIDPGVIEVSATADGYDSALRRIELGAGERRTLVLDLTPRAVEVVPAPPPPMAAVPPPRASDDGASHALPVLKWTFGAAAVAGVIAGGVFLVVQKSEASRYKRDCSSPTADPACDRLYDEVRSGGTWYTASIIGFGVGAALAATSAVFFALDASSEREQAAAGCRPGVSALGVACKF